MQNDGQDFLDNDMDDNGGIEIHPDDMQDNDMDDFGGIEIHLDIE